MITKEEYIAAAEKHIRKSRINLIITMVYTLILVITTFVLSTNRSGNPSQHLLMLIILLASSAVISGNSRKASHYKTNFAIAKALQSYNNFPYTAHSEGVITEQIIKENDPFRRAALQHILRVHYTINGNPDAAYKVLINDVSLFAADRFYELQYLNDLLNFYAEFGNDPGSLRYADEAAMKFDSITAAFPKLKKDFQVIEKDFDNCIMLSFAHGDYRRCADLLEARMNIYRKRKESSNSVKIHLAMDGIMTAECLFRLGDPRGALILCDEYAPALADINYQKYIADDLTARIRAALNNNQGEVNDYYGRSI